MMRRTNLVLVGNSTPLPLTLFPDFLQVFLATWKDIPSQNEVQFTLDGLDTVNADGVSTKMAQNNVFTVAKRTLEGQDMVYQSVKFTNNVWALAELKIQPGNPTITVSEGPEGPESGFQKLLNLKIPQARATKVEQRSSNSLRIQGQ